MARPRASEGDIVAMECPGDKITGEPCGHIYDISDLVEDLEAKNPIKRMIAKSRLRAFHWFHKISCRRCLCCGCKSCGK